MSSTPMANDAFLQFCGNSSIFDQDLLLNSDWPHFTQCFQDSLLVWIPCGWLWVVLPIYLLYLFRYHQGEKIAANFLNTAKTCGSVLLATLAVISLIQAKCNSVNMTGQQLAAVLYVSNGLKIATFIMLSGLIQIERLKGVVSSGVLWIFWFFLSVAGIIPFYSQIIQKQYNESMIQFTLFCIYYFLVLLELILHSFAEKLTSHGHGYERIGKEPSPELLASFPSRLIYHWITPLILLAYRKSLTEDDLFDLHPRDSSSRMVPQFQEAWDKELCYANDLNSKKKQQGRKRSVKFSQVDRHEEENDLCATESTSFPSVEIKYGCSYGEKNEKLKKVKASLSKVMVKLYGVDILLSFACKLVFDLLQFVSPILLNVLIAYTDNKSKEAVWKGYVYAVAFFVVAVVSSVFYQQSFQISMTLGMRIKTAITAAVFRKALTMSSEARRSFTIGEIVNIMSVDCSRIQVTTGYLYMLWSSPLMIILALILLWQQLGVSVLAGVVIMFLLIPVNSWTIYLLQKYQTQQMRLKDSRLKLMSEVLSGMKVLKLYAWEPPFEKMILDIRNKEMAVLIKAAYIQTFTMFTVTIAPVLVTLATFAAYVLSSDAHYLDAQKAFVSLSLFNILRTPISFLPAISAYMTQAKVSMVRLGDFLREEDLDLNSVQYDKNADWAVTVDKGTFTWDKSMSLPTLRNINLKIPKGKLVAIVGQVGSGKSSLLSAVLGEMQKLNGHVCVQSSIAYVAQQAWIQNATLMDNILFGSVYKEYQYDKVIDACALRPDLEILPGGDLTEIGEKGINLSGGQKQRVSLARAVYSNADIYLLDDPLSAVDSHVGKHIFQEVLGKKGLLREKTRLFVTHGVHWLPLVDMIIVMTDGYISEMGTYEDLVNHDGDFAQFVKTYLMQKEESEDEDPEIQAVKAKIFERIESVTSDTSVSSGDELSQRSGSTRKIHRLRKNGSLERSEESPKLLIDKAAKTIQEKKLPLNQAVNIQDRLTQEEKAEKGKVKRSVYMMYLRAVGLSVSLAVFLLYSLYQALNIYSSIWLQQWTDDDLLANISLANTSSYQNRNYMYLGIYAGLGLAQAIFLLGYSILIANRMVIAAGNLHAAMLASILRAPMKFFDTTPSGRIINRFSSDVAAVDNNLPLAVRNAILHVFGSVSTLILVSYGTPYFLTVIIPLTIIYYLIQRFYIPTSRQLKRLESTTRSPIFNLFSETITGAVCIRAYKVQDRFIHENNVRVDQNQVFYYAGLAANRWLGFCLEFLGNIVIFAAALFAVITPDIEGGLVGLSVSYAMQVTTNFNWLVRQMSELETNVVSVERLKEYSEVPREVFDLTDNEILFLI